MKRLGLSTSSRRKPIPAQSNEARRKLSSEDPKSWVKNGILIKESPRKLSGGGSIPIDSGN